MNPTQRCCIRVTSLLRRRITTPSSGRTERSGHRNERGARNEGRPKIQVSRDDIRSRQRDNAELESVNVETISRVQSIAFRSGGTLHHKTLLDPDADERARALNEVHPGDFVEVSASGRTSSGVVLPSSRLQESQTQVDPSALSIVNVTGEVRVFRVADVQFAIPAFVGESEAMSAQRSLVRSKEEAWKDKQGLAMVSVSSSEQLMEQFDEKRFMVRAQICAKLRTFLRQAELEVQNLSPFFERRYLFKSKGASDLDGEETLSRSVTVSEVAEQLLHDRGFSVAEAKNTAQRPATLYATHQLLRSAPSIFHLDEVSHRSTNSFTLLTPSSRVIFDDVKEMVQRSLDGIQTSKRKNDCAIEGFSRRVSQTVQQRKQAFQGLPTSSRLNDKPQTIAVEFREPPVEWTTSDRTILKFLRLVLGARRSFPFEESNELALHILSRCGYFSEPKVNAIDKEAESTFFVISTRKLLMTRFFADLGLLAPWDNLATLENEFHDRIERPNATVNADTVHDEDDERVRRDVYETVYVIDDANAAELDDGISIEHTSDPDQSWLRVHIADPTKAVRLNDLIAQDARRRHSSVYLPEAKWSMLPEEIVRDFGLRTEDGQGKEKGEVSQARNAMTFSAKVNRTTGLITDLNISLSLLRNLKVISYAEATEEMLGMRSTDEQTTKDLQALKTFAHALVERRRVHEGAFTKFKGVHQTQIDITPERLPVSHLRSNSFLQNGEIDTSQLYVGFPKIGFSILKEQEGADDGKSSLSQDVVAEMSLLAGRVAGRFINDRAIPALYRGQLSPVEPEKYAQLLSMRDERGQFNFMDALRDGLRFNSATMSHAPMEQFLMGFRTRTAMESKRAGPLKDDLLVDAGYVRVTSPLRRYMDMMMHWQIRHALTTRNSSSRGVAPFPISQQDIFTQLPRLLRMEQWHTSLERYSKRFWMLKRLYNAYLARLGSPDSSEYLPGAHDSEAIQFIDDVHLATVDEETIRMINLRPHVRMTLTASRIQILCDWSLSRSASTQKVAPQFGQIVPVRIVEVREEVGVTSILAKIVQQ